MMRPPKTVYLRINAYEVILVEIHSLNPKQRHLQDKTIQEIIELLRDTVSTRIENIKKKTGQVQQKNNKELSGILTGPSVRVGYSFKNKPGHQTCLYRSFLSDEDLSDYRVVQEKLVVYAQLLAEGSPKGMSQIMRRLSDVKQSSGNSVSISSYFQKASSPKGMSQIMRRLSDVKQSSGNSVSISSYFQKASSSQRSQGKGASGWEGTIEQKTKSGSLANDSSDGSVEPNKPEPVMKTGAPFSGGKRRIIKGILERGRFPGRKKKLKKVPAMVLSDEDSCESAQSVASEKAENNRPITHKEKASAAEKDSKSDTSTFIVNPDFNESHSFTVSKVDVDLTKSANMLNITFDPSQNIVKDERNRDKDKGSLDIREKSEERNDVLRKMETCSQVTEVNEEIVCLSPKLGRKACLNVEPVDITPDFTTSSPGSSDSEVLPSASFCGVSDGSRLSQRFSINTLNDILKRVEKRELKGIPEHSSPVFGGKSDSHKALVDEEVDSNDLPEFDHSSNTDGKENKKFSRIKSLNKFRFKRKLPKFSDSDSEDNFPEKKRQNVSAEKQSGSFTGNISTKRNCKEGKGLKGKLQISKDFFSNSKSSTAIQPTLSFFTKAVNKDKQKGVNNCVENTVLELPDIDNDHIPEMPDSPAAIDEADSELMQEVRSLSNVERLNEEQIRFLIGRHRSFLVRIFEGKSHCARHEAYKQGGKSRRNLNHASRLGPYTDEQLDIVMECLMGIFCKKHHKYLDYIMKVLLPEILIKFHMEINNTTQEESDRLLAPGTPEQVSSSS